MHEAKFRKFESGKMLGFVDLFLFDGAIKIASAKVFRGDNGIWVAMPSHKDNKEEEWKSDIYIQKSYTKEGTKVDMPAGDALNEAILAAVNKAMAADPTPKKAPAKMPDNIPF